MFHKGEQLSLEPKQPLTQRTLGQVRPHKGGRKRIQLTLEPPPYPPPLFDKGTRKRFCPVVEVPQLLTPVQHTLRRELLLQLVNIPKQMHPTTLMETIVPVVAPVEV